MTQDNHNASQEKIQMPEKKPMVVGHSEFTPTVQGSDWAERWNPFRSVGQKEASIASLESQLRAVREERAAAVAVFELPELSARLPDASPQRQ